MDSPIASAVVLPEELPPPASPNANKRRQPSTSEESAKRPRLDGDAPDGRRSSITDARPAAPVRREKGRERRLFGAVLGALSQAPSTTAAQRRRSEIEKRQLEQRKQESEENAQRKAERVVRRKVQRQKEQKRFEEQAMRQRHQNLLHEARFLKTESSPSLYYKPWETSAEEEDRIQTQISEAHKQIDREIEEYEVRQVQEIEGERRASGDANTNRDTKHAHGGKEHDVDVPHDSSSRNGTANGSYHSTKDIAMDGKEDHAEGPGREAVRVDATALNSTVASHEMITDNPSKDNDDENAEDVVEEAAEDTVIY